MMIFIAHRSVALVAATLFFLLTTEMLASNSEQRLTAVDEFQLQLAKDVQISPAGSKVIYVRYFADPMTDRRYSNLWMINSDGTDHRPITSGNRNDSSPRWSPDGTRIAYLSDSDGRQQIYVRWMDTGQTVRITNLDQTPDAISWSPDGTMLAYSALVLGRAPHVADLPSPPSGATWADPPKVYDRLVYRFDGLGYLKPGYSQIFIVSAEGGAPRQVTSGDFSNGGDELSGPSSASWSPDGKYLLASVNRHAESEHAFFDTEVYEFSVADGSMHALTHRKGPDDSPIVSPDGKWIAYLGYDDHRLGYQVNKLYLMNRDGSDSRCVSDNLDRDVRNPKWALDSSGVYFQYDDHGDGKIGFYSMNGNIKRVADHVASTIGAAGGGGSFSIARSGRIAFTYALTDRPDDIAVMDQESLNVLTTLNQGLLEQRKLGRVEEIWFDSSKDQRKIQGWIIYPPNFDKAKKYPLILHIHGGPFGDYGDRFSFEMQVYAAMGYVVLYTNPRGSVTYGEAFSNLIHHAYPGDDFADLNSGVDAVVARGFIDTDNLFVTGGSAGGLLTCWMIEHTHRFRAAASLYPITNWNSYVLTADIPFITQHWFPGNPWDYSEQYKQRSPTNLVANVKTPTLLMTGEDDYRTPISEAEQFYTALKLLNVDAVLVRVPGESHGINDRPSHHVAKILYVASWFEQHKSKH